MKIHLIIWKVAFRWNSPDSGVFQYKLSVDAKTGGKKAKWNGWERIL